MNGVIKDVEYENITLNSNLPAFMAYCGKENFDMRKSFYISPHWHRSIEINFVTEGEVIGFINGKSINVKSGEFVFVNSGDIHEMEKIEGKVCGVVILILSYEFVKKVYPNIDDIRFDFMNKDLKKDRLREIFLEMKELYLHPKELDYIKINSYIYEILHILLSNYMIAKDKNHTDSYYKYKEKKKEILIYISEHYKEELTLEHTSKKFYMSSEYFSRKFHEWFGVTYKGYLSNFRLQKAYEDIINSEDSIQNIALLHGFSNIKSFITLFKKKYSMTPLKYRQYLKESKNDIKVDKK